LLRSGGKRPDPKARLGSKRLRWRKAEPPARGSGSPRPHLSSLRPDRPGLLYLKVQRGRARTRCRRAWPIARLRRSRARVSIGYLVNSLPYPCPPASTRLAVFSSLVPFQADWPSLAPSAELFKNRISPKPASTAIPKNAVGCRRAKDCAPCTRSLKFPFLIES